MGIAKRYINDLPATKASPEPTETIMLAGKLRSLSEASYDFTGEATSVHPFAKPFSSSETQNTEACKDPIQNLRGDEEKLFEEQLGRVDETHTSINEVQRSLKEENTILTSEEDQKRTDENVEFEKHPQSNYNKKMEIIVMNKEKDALIDEDEDEESEDKLIEGRIIEAMKKQKVEGGNEYFNRIEAMTNQSQGDIMGTESESRNDDNLSENFIVENDRSNENLQKDQYDKIECNTTNRESIQLSDEIAAGVVRNVKGEDLFSVGENDRSNENLQKDQYDKIECNTTNRESIQLSDEIAAGVVRNVKGEDLFSVGDDACDNTTGQEISQRQDLINASTASACTDAYHQEEQSLLYQIKDACHGGDVELTSQGSMLENFQSQIFTAEDTSRGDFQTVDVLHGIQSSTVEDRPA
ncbi:unnamed protein product [Protopolystoma xenopodis]|uniref:Uncharacterized protein n=1 Tax=Protopolystoma xenopodis TaxID=117903 RepID=A0A448WT82_9PLAT|nr:unnamed protein product [Protopolystoma xenopodis]